jgi:tetratricopeptide (TPR) repeat protein
MAISYLLPFDLFQQIVYWLGISTHSYRKGRYYLEKNQGLLQEESDKELERLITAHAEERVETMQQMYNHQALLRDIRTRTNTSDSIREAYVNMYGGFTLDLPTWLEEIEKQITFLKKFHRPERTNRRQEQILHYALDKINLEANIAPEVCAELQNQFGCLLAQSSHYATQQERLQAFESAIRCHKAALQVFTIERYPLQYAKTCTYLGYAYQRTSIKGVSDSQERAIACYNAALQIYEQSRSAEQRANVETALGKIYAQRITGVVEENLALAVAYHEAALEAINKSKDIFARTWATIQINLGDTYLRYGNKDHGRYREQARTCYREALSIYTMHGFPKEWADIHIRLAAIYQSCAEGHQVERDLYLRCAIVCSEAALLIYSPDSFPFEYAATLVNLGHLHTIRTEGNRIYNLEQASKCYRKALRIFTRQDFPEECNLVLSNLSDAESKREALSQLVKGFTPAPSRV